MVKSPWWVGKKLNYISCFPLHFCALLLPNCLTTEQSTVTASLFVNHSYEFGKQLEMKKKKISHRNKTVHFYAFVGQREHMLWRCDYGLVYKKGGYLFHLCTLVVHNLTAKSNTPFQRTHWFLSPGLESWLLFGKMLYTYSTLHLPA